MCIRDRKYIVPAEKERVVRDLKALAKKADEVWLASDAVSYTHLDVYKRQIKNPANFPREFLPKISGEKKPWLPIFMVPTLLRIWGMMPCLILYIQTKRKAAHLMKCTSPHPWEMMESPLTLIKYKRILFIRINNQGFIILSVSRR